MIRVSCLLLVAGVLFAQAPAGEAAFEVASVKPAGANSSGGGDLRIEPGGMLTITNLSLGVIIRQAYEIRYHQMSGGPNWVNQDKFDILAKPPGPATREQVLLMLRSLLAERFQLKVRREVKEGNVYALVVAKNGPKLKEPTGDLSRIELFRITPPELPGVQYEVRGTMASMAQFASHLHDHFRRPVVDRTGLLGEFDFRVDYAIDDNPESGPSLLTALQEQLGLKLEPAKGMIETLVIEHVEKPSAN